MSDRHDAEARRLLADNPATTWAEHLADALRAAERRGALAEVDRLRAELEAAREVVEAAHHAAWCTRGQTGAPFTPCGECAGCVLRAALVSYDARASGEGT
jgi:hypothetical protein